jgi:homocysteine S-methyltransferase
VLVAGSLPPLRESYRAAAGLADFELMQPQYNELAGALKPYCDLLLCETLASVAEGLAAATAASASGLPWWVSWTVEDRQDAPLLRSGEPLAAAVEAVAQLPGLAALLVNCSCPQAVGAALPVLAAAAPPGVLVGGYANGFKTTTSEWLAAGSSSRPPLALPEEEYDAGGIILPEAYARHAARWRQLGAGIVGGCCGVGPAHIAELRKLFPLD